MRKIYLFGIVLLSVMIHSCELDINEDPNYPAEVKADKFFASGLIWTSSVIGGDLQLLGGMWSQHYAQNSASNQYTGIDSYNLPNSSSYITRIWGSLYAGALTDFQESIRLRRKSARGRTALSAAIPREKRPSLRETRG